MNSTINEERERIVAEYERREREIDGEFYALFRPANLFIRQSQQRALRNALNAINVLPLTERKMLEVGVGTGQWLSLFEDFGARQCDLSGIDLDEVRVAECRARYAQADVRVGDATALPWDAASFDIVFQSTVFTSVLDSAVRRELAAEMLRVLKPNGVVLWYDFSWNNPSNLNVRGIRRHEIADLFPNCNVTFRRVTLAPPIVRKVVPKSWLLASALEELRVFNTHLFAVMALKP